MQSSQKHDGYFLTNRKQSQPTSLTLLCLTFQNPTLIKSFNHEMEPGIFGARHTRLQILALPFIKSRLWVIELTYSDVSFLSCKETVIEVHCVRYAK